MLLIDRKMPKSCDDCVCNSDQYWCNLLNDEIDYEKTRMGRMPNCTLKEDERKTGKWIFIGDQMFECSECGTCYTQSQFHQMRVRISDTEFPKFCPNCGDAK